MAEIIISSGVVSTGITVAAGDIVTIQDGGELAGATIQNGGTVRGVYGALLTDVTAETGAIIDVAYGATGKPANSGMIIRGNATTIAEGALYYNGAAIAGAAAAGVLTGVSGTAPWRFNIGAGLTVENASLTSGTRIYANATGVISNTTILTSGNIDLKDQTVGSGVTAGGAGVTAATYNVYGFAYDTIVSKGGTLRVRPAGYASNATIDSEGKLIVDSNGAVASNVSFLSGGIGSVYRGGLLSGANVASGASVTVSGGTLSDAIMSYGGAVVVSGGGLLSGGSVVGSNAMPAAGKQVLISSGGTARGVTVNGARLIVSGGVAVGNIVSNGGQTIRTNGIASGTIIRKNGWEQVSKGGSSLDAVISANVQSAYAGGFISGTTVKGGKVVAEGVLSNITLSAGYAAVSKGGVANEVYISNGASALASSGGTVNRVTVYTGGSAIALESGRINDAVVSNGGFGIASSGGTISGVTVYAGGSGVASSGGTIVGGVTLDASARIFVSGGGVISDCTVRAGHITLWGSTGDIAQAYGTIVSGGSFRLHSSATVYDTVISKGGVMQVSRAGCVASGVMVYSGGSATVASGGQISNITVKAGGHLRIANMVTSGGLIGSLVLDLTGAAGCDKAMVFSSFNLTGMPIGSRIVKASDITDNSYTYVLVERGGNNNSYYNWTLDVYGNTYTWSRGRSVDNPLTGVRYTTGSSSFTSGTSTFYDLRLSAALIGSRVIDEVNGAAAALSTSGTTLNTSDRGALWTANTTVASAVYLANGMATGNAWLEIDGATVGGALYGAAAGQNFAGVVNMKLTSGSIKNLAAGAAAGGSVKAVNFELAGGELAGNAYAGGMGTVANAAKTTITGGTLAAGKNLYAGALWNKLSSATSVGEVTLTVKAGTINGNIYGASAVKTGTITTTAATDASHTVGSVTLTLAGGTAANAEFCAFAGGYATGTDTAKLASVYDAGDVSIDITGGTWGDAADARGGRGVFGGVMASGVKATAGNVSITVEAGTVANVFGGGWAQKGGSSTVENVEITVTGSATVANIFGCGIHSVTASENGASTTSVGDVNILLAGGNVTDNVFARGLLDGDAVTGEATITVTGSVDYGCNFYGFSRTAGEDDKAELVFADYTGTISGEVNGFKEVKFAGDTAMAFANDADISNTAWFFDLAERTTSGAAFASCEAATFADATVTLNIGEGQTLTGAWSIFDGGAATEYGTFDVQIGGTSILPDTIGLDERIASGDYAGWGFTVEDTVLKFKNLA